MKKFDIYFLPGFEEKLLSLPENIRKAGVKTIEYLSLNPKHPAFQTHKVKKAVGCFSEDVFEAYVTQKYRLTWEYGPEPGWITLRNIDNHDECLNKP